MNNTNSRQESFEKSNAQFDHILKSSPVKSLTDLDMNSLSSSENILPKIVINDSKTSFEISNAEYDHILNNSPVKRLTEQDMNSLSSSENILPKIVINDSKTTFEKSNAEYNHILNNSPVKRLTDQDMNSLSTSENILPKFLINDYVGEKVKITRKDFDFISEEKKIFQNNSDHDQNLEELNISYSRFEETNISPTVNKEIILNSEQNEKLLEVNALIKKPNIDETDNHNSDANDSDTTITQLIADEISFLNSNIIYDKDIYPVEGSDDKSSKIVNNLKSDKENCNNIDDKKNLKHLEYSLDKIQSCDIIQFNVTNNNLTTDFPNYDLYENHLKRESLAPKVEIDICQLVNFQDDKCSSLETFYHNNVSDNCLQNKNILINNTQSADLICLSTNTNDESIKLNTDITKLEDKIVTDNLNQNCCASCENFENNFEKVFEMNNSLKNNVFKVESNDTDERNSEHFKDNFLTTDLLKTSINTEDKNISTGNSKEEMSSSNIITQNDKISMNFEEGITNNALDNDFKNKNSYYIDSKNLKNIESTNVDNSELLDIFHKKNISNNCSENTSTKKEILRDVSYFKGGYLIDIANQQHDKQPTDKIIDEEIKNTDKLKNCDDLTEISENKIDTLHKIETNFCSDNIKSDDILQYIASQKNSILPDSITHIDGIGNSGNNQIKMNVDNEDVFKQNNVVDLTSENTINSAKGTNTNDFLKSDYSLKNESLERDVDTEIQADIGCILNIESKIMINMDYEFSERYKNNNITDLVSPSYVNRNVFENDCLQQRKEEQDIFLNRNKTEELNENISLFEQMPDLTPSKENLTLGSTDDSICDSEVESAFQKYENLTNDVSCQTDLEYCFLYSEKSKTEKENVSCQTEETFSLFDDTPILDHKLPGKRKSEFDEIEELYVKRNKMMISTPFTFQNDSELYKSKGMKRMDKVNECIESEEEDIVPEETCSKGITNKRSTSFDYQRVPLRIGLSKSIRPKPLHTLHRKFSRFYLQEE